jgi:hypothetical protein
MRRGGANNKQTTRRRRVCLVALLRRDKMVELAKDANRSPALTTTTDRSVVLATPSYRERMKAQRAEARAKRDAEKAEWHRRAELRYEVRRLALDAVKAGIRAGGTNDHSTAMLSS